MPTQHTCRMLFLVPAASCASFNTWIRNNLDPLPAGDWLTPNLSPTGALPATYAWANAALTEPEFKKIAARLLNLSSIAIPADFDTWTRDQKVAWLKTQRDPIRTALGVWCDPMPNDGTWDDIQDSLTAMGLHVIQPALP